MKQQHEAAAWQPSRAPRVDASRQPLHPERGSRPTRRRVAVLLRSFYFLNRASLIDVKSQRRSNQPAIDPPCPRGAAVEK
ncbi:hypothetical protein [Burkholderia gladioli]|uniref:hypothetical protein n=1 Tax=Burkholderia gladioli TaxID=28095 RepID=UPI0016403AD8|nr:hypothetical protein [Burkholderia gladioli]